MDYIAVHQKWDEYWKKNKTNEFNIKSPKPKYYCLEMFPYPSGANLHLGHFMNYAPSDTHARFKRMTGFNVFQPMGFDAFGLPAENYALKTNTHPSSNTVKNMEKMRTQLDELGGMYDWNYAVTTCFPDYYKWTQWLFVKLFEKGLAYQKDAPVNWCTKCNTVLANEQVKDGVCERCESAVVRKQMKQWFFKITDFAEPLLAELDNLDWPEKTKTMQRNWIGKSTGSRLSFPVDSECTINCFTTRIDTLFGVTFMAIAPEHPLANKLIKKEQCKQCDDYIAAAARKSDIERLGTDSEKTGVFTGSFCKHPVNGKDIPIYIGDYVLATYGEGAVMGVPAHDERDFAFAAKYNIPVVHVIKQNEDEMGTLPFCDDGILVNSGIYDGLTSAEARKRITKFLAEKKLGEFTTNYRLRDWGIGRQRYWGAPIPIVYCPHCGTVAETRLPVVLPEITNFRPKGSAPLAAVPEFVNTTCPLCGAPSVRECDTMDTFVCSSWYFLRFPDAKNDKEVFNKKIVDKMLPVDKYIGGAEHACMHLLYARFFTHFLHREGFINFKEPFTSLVHQGMILGTDGQKMSKSKGNTKEPDDYVKKYGSDILRLFIMFGFNYIEGGPWNDNTLKTVTRFTERIESLIINNRDKWQDAPETAAAVSESDKELLYVQHNTVQQVRTDLESFSFNTAVARCMELLNAVADYLKSDINPSVLREAVRTLTLLLAPMLPHIAEEYWELLGEKPSIFDQAYPIYNEKLLTRDTVEIAVQVNSKIVARINIPSTAAQPEIEKLADKEEKVRTALGGKATKKVIYIKGKLINYIC